MNSVNLMDASNQWATRPTDQRFESLADLRTSVHARRMRSRSQDLDLGRVHVNVTGNGIEVNSAIAPAVPSHWAFSQLAGQAGAPSGYLRTLPPALLADCLNHGIKAAGDSSVKFMTISNPEGDQPNTLQAVTSTTYGRIWDADCVDMVGRIQDRTGGRFFNPKAYDLRTGTIKPSGLYASDRDVFMFMIDGGSRLEVGPRAKLNRGFFVWNSETGSRSFGLMTFLFNEVCGNHIVWGAQDIRKLIIRHTSGGPSRFDTDATPALLAYAQASIKDDEAAITRAVSRMLPTEAADLESLVAPFKITRAELREAAECAKREEGQFASLWDLVQGLTAYARGFDFVDARVELETRAGKLLELVRA